MLNLKIVRYRSTFSHYNNNNNNNHTFNHHLKRKKPRLSSAHQLPSPSSHQAASREKEFNNVLQHFSNSAFVKSRCAQVGIGEGLFKAAAPAFCRMLKQDYIAKTGGKKWSSKRTSSTFHIQDDLDNEDGARSDESVSDNSDTSPSRLDGVASTPSLVEDIISSSSRSPMDRIILSHFFRYIQSSDTHSSKVSDPSLFKALLAMSDLSGPPDWYAGARYLASEEENDNDTFRVSRKRRVILHVGPTNSGKTYHALKRFYEAKNGIYCGPLRLLAHEVYEKCNSENVACNLLTGEEKRVSDGVNRWACTVEMANLNDRFDVAVIDEIQMLGDPDRGWAWTQALLGVQARELHLCGEASVVELLKKLCNDIGEELEVKEYERLTPLQVAKRPLPGGSLAAVQPADCVIAFSRRGIFTLKQEIEQQTKYRVAVIYGALPPETRTEQAKLFNSQQYQILVASDAIGMGLNLNIRRIIFDAMEKFDGKNNTPLTVSQIKQIGGRAGRFKSDFSGGVVTTSYKKDLKALEIAMESPVSPIKACGLLPPLEQIEKFSKILPHQTFSELLKKFEQMAKLSGGYFLCNIENLVRIADLLEEIPLTLRDRFTFIHSPTNAKQSAIATQLYQMAQAHSKAEKFSFYELELSMDPKLLTLSSYKAKLGNSTLFSLETDHRIVMLYLWLAIRMPQTFHEAELAMGAKAELEELINKNLMLLTPKKRRLEIEQPDNKRSVDTLVRGDHLPGVADKGDAFFRY